jgi:hypothetical protein
VNPDYGKDQSEEINEDDQSTCKEQGIQRQEALKIRSRKESRPTGRRPISIERRNASAGVHRHSQGFQELPACRLSR